MKKYFLIFILILIGFALVSVSFVFGFKISEDIMNEDNTQSISNYDENFTSLDLKLEFTDVNIIKRNRCGFDMKYDSSKHILNYRIDDGVLKIEDKTFYKPKKMSWLNRHEKENKINIYAPRLDIIEIKNGLGNLYLKDVAVNRLKINLELGNLKVSNLLTNSFDAKLELGNANIDGKFFNETVINSELGNVNLDISRMNKDYNCSASVGLGKICVNNIKKSGSYNINKASDNNFLLSSQLGNIKIYD